MMNTYWKIKMYEVGAAVIPAWLGWLVVGLFSVLVIYTIIDSCR